MKSKTEARPGSRSRRLGAKVSKTYRLNPERLAEAQKILGAATATEAIETALDMILFRRELMDGTRRLFGLRIDPPDRD